MGIFPVRLFSSCRLGGKPAVLTTGSSGDYVYATDGRGHWRAPLRANLVDFRGAVVDPDLTNAGYSTILLRDDEHGVTLYVSKTA